MHRTQKATDTVRLVASSEPGAVDRWAARRLIEERLILATAVCRELQECEINYAENLPAVALSLLREWVSTHYPRAEDGVQARVDDGLSLMIVPPEDEDLMQRLGAATYVCKGLAMLWTADHRSEYESDTKKLYEALTWWQSTRPAIREGPPTA
jgi:hypothetical protein